MQSTPRKLSRAGFAQRYKAALRSRLLGRVGKRDSTISDDAVESKLDTLDLTRIHEQSLVYVLSEVPAAARRTLFNRAGSFFAEAIAGIERTHRAARQAHAEQERLSRALGLRKEELANAHRELKRQMAQRKTTEKSLQKSKRHFVALLQHSCLMQQQLRHLSRKLLTAQEEERKTISRDLHDEVGQTLAEVNVELAALKRITALNTVSARNRIDSAQRLVAQSVKMVHQFARELRPSVLDDLGLIPALNSYLRTFSEGAGLPVRLKMDPRVETLDCASRTVLYRVALEALTNVCRHAKATRVELTIEVTRGLAELRIKDDGKSFSVKKTLGSKTYNRLGLLGMRERVEMVGGQFNILSAPGNGTTVLARIPFGDSGAPAPCAAKAMLPLRDSS